MTKESIMDVVEVKKGIFEFKSPQEMNAGEWLEQHLDCDTIVDDLGEHIVVYAYTLTPEYNGALSEYRQEKYTNQYVLRGISSDGLNSIF